MKVNMADSLRASNRLVKTKEDVKERGMSVAGILGVLAMEKACQCCTGLYPVERRRSAFSRIPLAFRE
jgi:hypothetical protein